MNIAEIIELVRGSLREEDLVPVKELKDKTMITSRTSKLKRDLTCV